MSLAGFACFGGTSFFKLGQNRFSSATFKMKRAGKEVGFKILEDGNGTFIFSAREINGKKLCVIPMGKRTEKITKSSITKKFKLEDGKTHSIKIAGDGRISTGARQVQFSQVRQNPGGNNPSSEGFFSWLGNLVHDVATGIAAAFTWLTGGAGIFNLSGGGTITIVWGGDIEYNAGGGFKLEPGMEENPLVWY